MKRTILCLIAGILFLVSSAVSAAPRKIYEFPQQPSSKVVANMLRQTGFNSPPAIETNQEIRVEDATMVLESGTYDTVYVGASDIVYYHQVTVTGMLTVEPGAYLLPAKSGWLAAWGPDATATIGAPGGEFVQILGDITLVSEGIAVVLGASAVMHNVLAAGMGARGIAVIGEEQDKYTPSLDATNLYLTNNRAGLYVSGSATVKLERAGIWDNHDQGIYVSDGFDQKVRFRATESWIRGKLDLTLGTTGSSAVFDRCNMVEGFVELLHSQTDYGLERVTVLENRPLTGVVQTWPRDVLFLPADFTGSGEVNAEDVALLSQAFGSPRDSIEFGNLYDLNRDGMVNLPDMLPLAYDFTGVSRTEPIATLARNPKMPELLSIITQYPAVVAAAKADLDFGPIVQNYLDGLNPTAVAEISGEVPSAFSLGQNYPNPFNPETTIRFSLSENADVVLAVYNTTGQVVARLVNEPLSAGLYNVQWDGRMESGQLSASGMYFYRIDAGEYTEMRRMTLLR